MAHGKSTRFLNYTVPICQATKQSTHEFTCQKQWRKIWYLVGQMFCSVPRTKRNLTLWWGSDLFPTSLELLCVTYIPSTCFLLPDTKLNVNLPLEYCGQVAKMRARYIKFVSAIKEPIQEEKNADVKLGINGKQTLQNGRYSHLLITSKN